MKTKIKSYKSDTLQNNFYDGKIFWDLLSEYNQEICQVEGCKLPAVGRVQSDITIQKFPSLGYMDVCEQHLKEFQERYGV